MGKFLFNKPAICVDVHVHRIFNRLGYIQTKTPEETFKIIKSGTREHTRILLPWNETVNPCHEGLVQEINQEITAQCKINRHIGICFHYLQ